MPKVITIVGPTASGKTALSIRLAKQCKGEIISADSRQVYRGLDIGTEKISKHAMRGVPHHLIDVANPKKPFTASDFKKLGEKAVADILRKRHTPIIVGGTGFYIDALIHDTSLPEVPPNLKLRKQLEKKSVAQLYALLKKKDPARAKTIDQQNPRRLIRALEIVAALGRVPDATKRKPKYDVLWIGLSPNNKTYEHVLKKRLRKQLKIGLLREIKKLLTQKVPRKRINELGLEYRTGLEYLDGKLTKDEMLSRMLRELRQYSKRQMTWFKPNTHIHWLGAKETQKASTLVSRFLLQ